MRAHEAAGSRESLAEREQLRKEASGKSVRWRELLILLLGMMQFLLGAVTLVVFGASAVSVLPLATGALFVALSIWQILNARIDAIWKYVNSGKPT